MKTPSQSPAHSAANSATCAAVVIHLLLIQPLWYVLLFAILQRIETESWMWVCYWVYVPAAFVAAAFTQIAKVLFTSAR